MRSKIALGLLGVLFCLAPLSAEGSDPKAILKSVGNQVNCLCGCVALLNQCPHPPAECSMRSDMETLILKDAAGGKNETATIQDLVLRYGVRVLATPPAKGFNLMVWILPAVGVIVGLILLMVVTRRWRKAPAEPSLVSPGAVDPKVLAAVEEEMKASEVGKQD